VLDFGLVRAAAPGVSPRAPTSRHAPVGSAGNSKLDMQLTQDDQIVGTPAYMAPEHWRGLSPDPAADQFSFCVALYEALYGAPPFPHEDASELVQRVLAGQVAEPPRRRGLPGWLAPVVLRGLANDPKVRSAWPKASVPSLPPACASGGPVLMHHITAAPSEKARKVRQPDTDFIVAERRLRVQVGSRPSPGAPLRGPLDDR
jgi:serine/threonine protein kinase